MRFKASNAPTRFYTWQQKFVDLELQMGEAITKPTVRPAPCSRNRIWSRLLLPPSGEGCISRDFTPLLRSQLFHSRSCALLAPTSAEGNCCWVLSFRHEPNSIFPKRLSKEKLQSPNLSLAILKRLTIIKKYLSIESGKENRLSLYKRKQIWWTDFSVRGRRFRISLDTSDKRQATRRERERIAEVQNSGTLSSLWHHC